MERQRFLTRNRPHIRSLRLSGLPKITEKAFLAAYAAEAYHTDKHDIALHGVVNLDISNCEKLSVNILPLIREACKDTLRTLSLQDFPHWPRFGLRLLFQDASFKHQDDFDIVDACSNRQRFPLF